MPKAKTTWRLGDYTDRRLPYIIAAGMAEFDLTLGAMQRQYIELVLGMVQGNISVAAKVLGVSRRMLERNGFGLKKNEAPASTRHKTRRVF